VKLSHQKLFYILALAALAGLFTHCGSPFQQPSQLVFESNIYGGPSGASEAAFAETLWPISRSNCVSCHAQTQPLHAHSNPSKAHDDVLRQFKVNFNNPANSRMVAKLRDENHNCWSDCAANALEIQQAIVAWRERIKDSAPPQGPPPEALIESSESRFLAEELSDSTNPQKTNTLALDIATGMLTAPMVRSMDDAGPFIHVPNNGQEATLANNAAGAGMAHFNFRTPATAQYRIWALVHAPNNNDNGFYFQVSTQATPNTVINNVRTWDIAVSPQVRWQLVPGGTFNLTGGVNHTLRISQRKDGAKIYRIVITPDTSFNGSELETYLGVTLTLDVSSALQMPSARLLLDISDYDLYSYKVSRPRLVGLNSNVRVRGVRVLLNKEWSPQHSTYVAVDRIVTPQDGLISEFSMILIKDKGTAGDRISVRFDQLNPTELAPGEGGGGGGGGNSLPAFTASAYQVSRTYCINCHTTQSPRHASDNALVAHDAYLDRNLADFNNPANSRIVTKVRGGHNCGNQASCNNIADQFVQAITEWRTNR
jgi:hypothetical protein